MKNLKTLRIILYIFIIISLIALKLMGSSLLGECYINKNFGLLCPSCGITRATESLLNLDFTKALSYNSFYVLILLPIFLVLAINDIICMILNKKSLVDIIFDTKTSNIVYIIIATILITFMIWGLLRNFI